MTTGLAMLLGTAAPTALRGCPDLRPTSSMSG